jgi:hypothetical protein
MRKAPLNVSYRFMRPVILCSLGVVTLLGSSTATLAARKLPILTYTCRCTCESHDKDANGSPVVTGVEAFRTMVPCHTWLDVDCQIPTANGVVYHGTLNSCGTLGTDNQPIKPPPPGAGTLPIRPTPPMQHK